MKDIRSTVMQLSGRLGNACYDTLCLAIEAAQSVPPEEFQMKRIWSEVRNRTGKSTNAISRALARAANDIWERGNRALLCEIFGRKLVEAPTSKELVLVLAEYLRPRVAYQCWAAGLVYEFGIQASDDYGARLVTAPFTRSRAGAERLVAMLNESQLPLDEFRIRFLTGELPGLPERTQAEEV